MHTKTNRIALLGLLIACFLLSSNLGVSSVSAASATITTNTNITLDTSSAGDGVTIDEESINITTTCNKGYDLTIATSTSTNLYLNGDSTKTAAYTAVDGTSALNSSNNTNKWGYTLTNDATASAVFSPLSTTASTIRTISQTTNLTSETIPIYYGIKTDNTVDPGTYSMGDNGVITYYLTMNPLCNVVDIAYDGNNADAGTMGAEGTGVIHTGKKDGDTIDLIASNFSRDGYGFAGWSTDPDAGTKLLDNDNTNNPIVYGPQETITLPEGFADNDTDNDGIVKLYAVWLQSQGNLQGWAGCANLDAATYDSTTGALDLTKNSVTALTDMRDHDTYAVARLADGQCWMIENLRLDADATRGNNQYDPSVTNEFLAQGYGKYSGIGTNYGDFAGLADAESTNFGNAAANSLYYSGTQSGTATINIGTSNHPGDRMPRYNNLNTPANANDRPQNPTINTATNTTTNAGLYSYGNYYTWAAAIADTSYYDSGDHNTSSICPASWNIPLGNISNGDINQGVSDTTNRVGGFSFLDRKMGGTGAYINNIYASQRLRKYPNNFIYSGFYKSSPAFRGTQGYYWSSTVQDVGRSYRLHLVLAGTQPGTEGYSKTFSYSIRCTIPGNLYAIHFDANTTDAITGTMANQAIAVDESAQLNINSFQRPATSSAAYRFVKWNTKPDGSGTDYADGASVTNLAAAGKTVTLYAQWEQVTPMTVNFNGNGLSFADSSIANTVYYANTCSTKYVSAPSYSHTSNINDDGTQIDTTKYNNNLATKDVITIPGATSLHATITYGTENNYDMLYVFQGEYTGSVTRNMSVGQLQKYMGGNNTTTTVELDIPGDTATFAFYSDSSGQYWGYHASVVGYYDTEPASYASTAQICSRSHVSGKYKTPDTGSLRTFYGWNENQSATTVDYATADEVLKNLPGNNGETKTLYAIWKNNLTINYNANGGTGTTASQTVAAGERITLKSNSFTAPANMAFGGWNTEPDGTGTSYSANTTFTAPNSVAYNDSLTLYAQWIPQRQIIYNDNCSYNNAGCATSTDTTNTSSWTNAGSSITLGSDSYFTTRSGYAITSWNTARDGSGTSYNISSSYTVPSTLTAPDQVTLYAQWSPALTINFNGNGGTGTMAAQLIAENTSKALQSNSFTAPSGLYFTGWMTEESRTNNEVVYANKAAYTTPTTVTPGDSVTLYAKWGPRYTIVYNGNNATGGSMVSNGTELKHTNINEGSTIDLYAPNYWKTNHGFVGWSPSSTATVGGADPIYGPNESISAPSYDTYGEEISGTKTITLYAIWLEADSNKTMQTFTISDCQNLSQATYDSTTGKITVPANSVIALKDQRDNNVYTVARLADGNCWMTENLRLEAENTVGNNQYDSSVTNESLSQGYDDTFIGLDSSENSNFSSTNATPNNLYNSTNITGDSTKYRFPRYNNNNTNTSLTASYSGSGSDTYYSWYSYGNYYSWHAAMANTTYYNSAIDSEAVGTSLCPTNWNLPTSGNASKDFGTLSQVYGGTGRGQSGVGEGDVMSERFRSFPNNFLYSGGFYVSFASYRGRDGFYWSKSAQSSYDSFTLGLSSSYLYPSDSNLIRDGKGAGLSVRCLIDNTYTIRYDGNNADGGSMISNGVELKHTGLVGGETIDLYPSNYYKTGYGFAGWSMDPDAWSHFIDNDSTNDPTIYGPMETITAPLHPGYKDVTFYAVWVPAEEDNNNIVYLQDFDNTSCSNLTSVTYDSTTGTITANKNSIVALTDKRDGNVYTVARLADGNCWMTENLRLEAEGTVGNNQYDSSVTNESLAQGYGKAFIGLDSSENSNFNDVANATPNNMYNSTNVSGYTGLYHFPRYNNNNTNTSLTASYNGTGSSQYYSWYSYGNYYTWAAAIANTTHYYTSDIDASGSESANTSICPINWALPTSGTTIKDFGNLSQQYGGTGDNESSAETGGATMSNRFRSFPNNFLYPGQFYDSSARSRGDYGNYWSRSASATNVSYSLNISSSSLYPSGSSSKIYGISVRCLIHGS